MAVKMPKIDSPSSSKKVSPGIDRKGTITYYDGNFVHFDLPLGEAMVTNGSPPHPPPVTPSIVFLDCCIVY